MTATCRPPANETIISACVGWVKLVYNYHCEERSDEAIPSPLRRNNSVRRPAQGADLGELARQFRPALAGILGLIEFAVMATRDDEPGIGWMRRESPDRRVRLHR